MGDSVYNQSGGLGYSSYQPIKLLSDNQNTSQFLDSISPSSYNIDTQPIKLQTPIPKPEAFISGLNKFTDAQDDAAFRNMYANNSTSIDSADNAPGTPTSTDPSFMKELFGGENMMGNITGLAGTLMQAIALPEMLKNAKLQNKSLKFNLATAQKEQQRRDDNIASFNNHGSAPTTNKSAFV